MQIPAGDSTDSSPAVATIGGCRGKCRRAARDSVARDRRRPRLHRLRRRARVCRRRRHGQPRMVAGHRRPGVRITGGRLRRSLRARRGEAPCVRGDDRRAAVRHRSRGTRRDGRQRRHARRDDRQPLPFRWRGLLRRRRQAERAGLHRRPDDGRSRKPGARRLSAARHRASRRWRSAAGSCTSWRSSGCTCATHRTAVPASTGVSNYPTAASWPVSGSPSFGAPAYANGVVYSGSNAFAPVVTCDTPPVWSAGVSGSAPSGGRLRTTLRIEGRQARRLRDPGHAVA